MKWIVGLDLRKDSLGAIAMARWLHEHGTTPDHHSFTGVHVIDAPVRAAIRDDEIDIVVGHAQDHAHEVLAEAGADKAFARVEAVLGVRPERSLEAGATFHGADGIVIGRHGPAKTTSLVRLGEVARRMLRWLPTPVMVVPPDLSVKDMGDGPIVACTDQSQNSLAACRFARRLADGLSRELSLVSVIPSPGSLELGYLTERVVPVREPDLDEAERQVEQWVEGHGLRVDEIVVRQGHVIGELVGAADERDAPVIVCGSRRLSLPERMYQSSIGSTLAAGAVCAVTIVPTPGS